MPEPVSPVFQWARSGNGCSLLTVVDFIDSFVMAETKFIKSIEPAAVGLFLSNLLKSSELFTSGSTKELR